MLKLASMAKGKKPDLKYYDMTPSQTYGHIKNRY